MRSSRAELVEQLALVPLLPTHHRPVLRRRCPQLTESPFDGHLNAFIDSSGQKQTSRWPWLMSAPCQKETIKGRFAADERKIICIDVILKGLMGLARSLRGLTHHAY